MNNYELKILNIKENQKKLLEMVKDSIEKEGIVFNINTRNIVDVLYHDSKVTKKYEAVVKAQQLIEEYTKQIKEATSIEEIKEIRKKLNSCITKIKKEMKNRGIDDAEYESYSQSANNLRKRIAENIRYLKREEKINEIESLYSNFDNLNEEELLRFKKLVKNETSYGKRNIVNHDKVLIPKKKPEDNKEDDKSILLKLLSETKTDDNTITVSPNQGTIFFETFDSLDEFLSTRINFFERQYKIKPLQGYNGSIIKNITVFTRNLPKLIMNKNKVRYMVRDYHYFHNNLFYRKPELLGYSNYTGMNNSIIGSFKQAIRRSVFKEKEDYYLEEHNKVIEWVINFCKNNHMEIRFNKTISAN